MEQGRLFLAIVLSFLVFVGWEFFFVEKPTSPPEMTSHTSRSSQSPASEAPQVSANAPPTTITHLLPTEDIESSKTISIDTPLYSAVISEINAAITGFTLKNYKEQLNSQSKHKSLISPSNPYGTAILGLRGETNSSPQRVVFTTRFHSSTLNVTTSPQSISFFWQSPDGILVEKAFTFYPDSYKIGMSVKRTNKSDQPLHSNIAVSMLNASPSKQQSFSFEGPFVLLKKHLEEVSVKDLDEKNRFSGPVSWAGLTEPYFMTAIGLLQDTSSSTVFLKHHDNEQLLEVQLSQSTKSLAPDAHDQFDFLLYLGPKRMSSLKAVGNHLDLILNFGFFDIIAKPCLWLMNTIHDRLIPNYGIAIILLTILFKLLFWPLGTKSYKSMAEMKKLQPLMAQIREKYKRDQKKMNEEIMGLYKTYKVNPMSGCLPMLVQIPVFFAFYRMLYGSIELRHAPFFGWITDLSAPDRLFSFSFAIPLMTPPYGIPVLTIIMGATMFIQQKLSPPPGDPTQARIMMLMPLIFTFIFINFPAGLVLYWLVNNVLSISQQYYITKKMV